MNRATFFKQFELLADQPDAVAKMRGLVLELAIQGKVVAQNPKDEPASKLLERVSAHSAANDNARAKKSRDEIESLVPAEFWHLVPASWAIAPLGTVTNIIRGITFPSSAKGRIREKGTVACLRTANVQNEIEWDDLLFIPENYVGRDDQWLKPNDLVISMANSAALVGKVAQARVVPEKASFGGFLAVIRPIELDSTYLLYFLRAPSVQAALRATSSQTTNIANISLGGMRPLPVAIPPLAEQRRIVAKVDELMALCDELEQRQEARQHAHGHLQQSALHHLLAAREPQTFAAAWQRVRDNFHLLHDTPDAIPQLRQAILQLAVQGRLLHQNLKDEPAHKLLTRLAGKYRTRNTTEAGQSDGSHKPFELPTGWSWAHFQELGVFSRGKSRHRPRNEPSLYTGGKYPLVQTGDVARSDGIIRTATGFYNEKGLAQSKLWPVGTMCITIAANIAETGILGMEACIPDSVVGFVPDKEFGGAEYFEFFMRTAKARLQDFAPSTAQKNINMEILESVSIPLPPLAEQKRIVARVEELLRWCDTLEAQLHQTRTLGAHLLASTLHHLLAA